MARHSNVSDEGTVFVIVPNTRKVAVPSAHFVIGTVGEHLSEQITFECPKTIDGHDITACDRKYVTWQNVNGIVGHDELVGMTVEGDVAKFKWNIRNGLTTAKGVVSFSVHFEDTADDQTVYKFSTTTCKSCEILDAVNALLGAYEAVYVADETLIFGDYHAVTDSTLKLDGNKLMPEGTVEITANGTHDVGKFAQARVQVEDAMPSITVSKEGLVSASTPIGTTTHQLSASDDPDFKPENIKYGVKILGVSGNCPTVEYVLGKMANSADCVMKVYYFGINRMFSNSTVAWGDPSFNEEQIYSNGSYTDPFVVAKNSLIGISLTGGAKLTVTGNAKRVYEGVQANGGLWIVKPTGNDFQIVAE